MATNRTLSRMIGDATAIGLGIVTAVSAAAARATLGLGALATKATVDNTDWSGTDLSIANGGTGASTAAAARTALGIGSGGTMDAANVAITGGTITGIIDLAIADGGTGSSTAAAAATALGLGTGNSPNFAGVNVGHATDTTLTRASAGNLAVEGNALYRAGGTDVPITDGGTGSSSASGARTNLGLGTAALEIYEEGTFTPTFTFATPGNLSVAYAIQAGTYVRIGSLVIITSYIMRFTPTYTTASGAPRFSGLPYASLASVNPLSGMFPVYLINLGHTGGFGGSAANTPTFRIAAGATYFEGFGVNGGGPIDAMDTLDCPSGTQITVTASGMYRIT